MATPDEQNYINERWAQLNRLSKDSSDRAVGFLTLMNSGGAIAMLSFLGAVPTMRTQWAPKMALASFVVGIIFVGIHLAYTVHLIDFIFGYWRRDAIRFAEGHISWQTLVTDDNNRAQRTMPLYITGYISFACFIGGSAIGLIGSAF